MTQEKDKIVKVTAASANISTIMIDGEIFHLSQNHEDDSRGFFDDDDNAIVYFTSDCYVLGSDYKRIGRLGTTNGYFCFTPTSGEVPRVLKTNNLRQWHWKDISDAELEIGLLFFKAKNAVPKDRG